MLENKKILNKILTKKRKHKCFFVFHMKKQPISLLQRRNFYILKKNSISFDFTCGEKDRKK